MDWKRVKSILIALLLATNLILGYNLYRQVTGFERAEGQALLAALGTLENPRGMEADMFLRLPARMTGWRVLRDSEAEQAFARGLLGGEGFEQENTGGGIVGYRAAGGTGTIKKGGEMAFALPEAGEGDEAAAAARALLAAAGVKPADFQVAEQGPGRVVCAQLWQGLPLMKYHLAFSFGAKGLAAGGRWLASSAWEEGAPSPSPSQLVLYLAARLEELSAGRVLAVSAVYYAAEGLSDLEILPAWRVETESGEYIFGLESRSMVG